MFSCNRTKLGLLLMIKRAMHSFRNEGSLYILRSLALPLRLVVKNEHLFGLHLYFCKLYIPKEEEI